MSKPTHFHPMETAPLDGTTVWLLIRPIYVGCPIEVLGSYGVTGWTSDVPLDSSRDIEPIGWAET